METQKHPKGLYVLFFTEMWERFSFYSMLAMFTLYLRDPKDGFGWTAANATTLYSNYLMFVYASPLIGGWLADRKLGYRRSVMIGGFFFMAGHLLLSVPSLTAVYAALTCLVIGNGFFKPNVSAMVGALYPEGSHLKDRAYNIFYMGINIGAFLAPVTMEVVKGAFGFHPAFAVAAFGMVISVSVLWRFKRFVEDPRRTSGDPLSGREEPEAAAVTADVPPLVENRRPIDAIPDWQRVGALVVIFAIVIVFWMVFHQNGSTLTYWANDNTDWQVSGIISNAINPFWVVTLTFPLVWLWKWLDSKGMEPSTPLKMTMGMFLSAACFGILYLAARTGEKAEVRPDMLEQGEYRVNDRVLGFLKEDGVPAGVIDKLEQAKGADEKSIVKDKKFKTDKKFSEALATVKQNLESEGLPTEDWNVLKDATFEEDAPLRGDRKFSEALAALVGRLREKGLSEKTAQRMLAYKDEEFTGQVKLIAAVERVVGPEDASRYRAEVLTRAYLFKVSPLWLILAYAVVTLGELLLSPMGLALVSKVAPIRLRGLMMGGWFVATAIGNKLTMIGVFWDQWLQSTFFAVLGGMALAMAFVLLLLLRPLKKAMPGV